MTAAAALVEKEVNGLPGTILTIDLSALRRNWEALRLRSAPAECAAVVKADAYGLGVERVAAALPECRTFFVATPQEGAALRPIRPDATIYVLSGPWSMAAAQAMADCSLRPVINTPRQLTDWLTTGLPFALHLDTGMNRLGLTDDQAAGIGKDVRPSLLISHLACADDPDIRASAEQRERFKKISQAFEGVPLSLSNSAGVFLGDDYHFDLTRPGIALYGGSAGPRTTGISSVIRLSARIIQLREARAGEAVSYGYSHRLKRDSRLATVAIGYADGFLRSASGSGVPLRSAVPGGAYAMHSGTALPLLGRITMDLSIFDATDVPPSACQEGEWVEIIGDAISVDDVARRAGTIGYEVLTALGRRHDRRYV
ncbi:alanine racemase [Notoacmeibacter ruber]|uniref:Alanine racemase n=1 Tax=Notoacmeibacter ruber TaxID=2670375 RepID=A0A3L7JAH6_9HYPH|nr:alanine racemase [Notoacmeibacter ruber]RLQ87626.1 alanine racemase [Notoacmeibacter ruber]